VMFALAISVSEPKILSVAPDRIAVAAQPQRITVTGEDFRDGLTLAIAGPDGQVRQISGADVVRGKLTEFTVSVAFTAAGAHELVVTNTDGGKSAPFRIDVKRPVPPPAIEQVLPQEITRSQEAQVLTIRGGGFEPGMRLSLTDPTGTVTVITVFERLEPTIAVVRVVFEVSGTYGLMATNPSGGASNTVSLTVR